MLEPIRDEFANRFFDVGICESHAVAMAAGMAKAGLRPVVDIYSTFLQRSYDQIFQEVSLQDLPVTFLLDRAGVVGPDGPTHHGVFDIAYLRVFPNLVVMSPGDPRDLELMIPWALNHDHPTTIRYPKANAVPAPREAAPIELGESELVRSGGDGVLIAFGPLLSECLKAAETMAEEGIELAVINAHFVEPLGYAGDPPGGPRAPVRGHGGRGLPDGRLRERRIGGGQRGRAGHEPCPPHGNSRPSISSTPTARSSAGQPGPLRPAENRRNLPHAGGAAASCSSRKAARCESSGRRSRCTTHASQ